mmetsp:Transcript_7605/g.27134  ORF Transcript_7605/g.27134 Transcript_7605/m.27134 type:complete len:181 (+) Transcript_7605:1180-1722(+)
MRASRFETYFKTILTKQNLCFEAKIVVRVLQRVVSRVSFPFSTGNTTQHVGGIPLSSNANSHPLFRPRLSAQEGLEWSTPSKFKLHAGPMVKLQGWMTYVSSRPTYPRCLQAFHLVQERLSTGRWLHQAVRAHPESTRAGFFAVRSHPRRGSTCFQLMVSVPFLGCGWLFALTGTRTFLS